MQSTSPIEICLLAEISHSEYRRSQLFAQREIELQKMGNLTDWLHDLQLQVGRESHSTAMVTESVTQMCKEIAEQKNETVRTLEEQCDRLWRHRKRLEYLLEEYRENPPDPLRN